MLCSAQASTKKPIERLIWEADAIDGKPCPGSSSGQASGQIKIAMCCKYPLCVYTKVLNGASMWMMHSAGDLSAASTHFAWLRTCRWAWGGAGPELTQQAERIDEGRLAHARGSSNSRGLPRQGVRQALQPLCLVRTGRDGFVPPALHLQPTN